MAVQEALSVVSQGVGPGSSQRTVAEVAAVEEVVVLVAAADAAEDSGQTEGERETWGTGSSATSSGSLYGGDSGGI